MMGNSLDPHRAPFRAFINYRRQEAPAEAAWLHEVVVTAFGPKAVFVDTSDLRGGEEWWRSVQAAIASSAVMIVVMGPGWLRLADVYGRRLIDNEEDWVRLEIEAGLAAKLTMIPLLLEGTVLPPKEALPKSLRPLVDFQKLDFHVESRPIFRGAFVERLAELGFKPVSARQATRNASRRRRTRESIMIRRQLRTLQTCGELAARAEQCARQLCTRKPSRKTAATREVEERLIGYHAEIEDLLFKERVILPDDIFVTLHRLKYDLLDLLASVSAPRNRPPTGSKQPTRYTAPQEAYSALRLRYDELLKQIKVFMSA